MKHVEQFKTIALFLLILLSMGLTFTIWTYTPNFEQIEPAPAVDASIGESKSTEDIIKPIKAVYHFSDLVTGTVDQEQMDSLLAMMEGWEIQQINQISDETSTDVMTQYMHDTNRTVIYYPGNVPFPVFNTLMNITDNSIPEATFDRVVIDWEVNDNNYFNLYFINSLTGRIHQGEVIGREMDAFQNEIVEQAFDFEPYTTNEAIGELPVYVSAEATEETSFTYLLEEITPRRFVNGLFNDPANVVQSTGDLPTEEYTDDTSAIMRVENSTKSISYVQPRAETSDPGVPSELVESTLDFINEHGGWTDEYRYFGMNPIIQQIEYRLVLNNKPVFSTMSSKLELRWGADAGSEQIFRYIRPYYELETLVSTTNETFTSGTEALELVTNLDDVDLSSVTEVLMGYELSRDEEQPDSLMVLQPAWYYKYNGVWIRLSRDALGGETLGLE